MSEILQPTKRPQGSNPALSVGERNTPIMFKLSEMFKSTDFVRVINIDTEAVDWDVLNPADEVHDLDPTSSTVPMRITKRGEPEHFHLEPGQSALVPGRVAYIFIDVLYKRLIAKRAIGDGPSILPMGRNRNFSFSDDQMQRDMIKEIYLGKELPGTEPVTNSPESPQTDAVTEAPTIGTDEPQAPKANHDELVKLIKENKSGQRKRPGRARQTTQN